MARGKDREEPAGPSAISIIGPGMILVGDLATEGTVRIEGRVEGTVHAGKAVVIGKEGVVAGDLRTQDAIIAGRVTGSLLAASRLEVQASARIDGAVMARRIQLAEGSVLNGEVRMGEFELSAAPPLGEAAPRSKPGHAGNGASGDMRQGDFPEAADEPSEAESPAFL